jgi:hypothetical protein
MACYRLNFILPFPPTSPPLQPNILSALCSRTLAVSRVLPFGCNKKIKIMCVLLTLCSRFLSRHLLLSMKMNTPIVYKAANTINVSETFTMNYDGDYNENPPPPVSRLQQWVGATCRLLMIKAFSSIMLNCNATP